MSYVIVKQDESRETCQSCGEQLLKGEHVLVMYGYPTHEKHMQEKKSTCARKPIS